MTQTNTTQIKKYIVLDWKTIPVAKLFKLTSTPGFYIDIKGKLYRIEGLENVKTNK